MMAAPATVFEEPVWQAKAARTHNTLSDLMAASLTPSHSYCLTWPQDQRNQGGLIDVPPVQPSPAGEEVQLVPEPSVPSGDREMESDGRERQDQRRAMLHARGP
jgi:hypothetical protein